LRELAAPQAEHLNGLGVVFPQLRHVTMGADVVDPATSPPRPASYE
jgi:hypothetical protein